MISFVHEEADVNCKQLDVKFWIMDHALSFFQDLAPDKHTSATATTQCNRMQIATDNHHIMMTGSQTITVDYSHGFHTDKWYGREPGQYTEIFQWRLDKDPKGTSLCLRTWLITLSSYSKGSAQQKSTRSKSRSLLWTSVIRWVSVQTKQETSWKRTYKLLWTVVHVLTGECKSKLVCNVSLF